QVRAELHSLFRNFSQTAEAEDLKAAGIGEQRALPTHEPVQSAQVANNLVSRPQIKMIGIAQDDLRAQLLKNVLGNGLHRTRRAARHKGRRLQGAVCSVNAAPARRAGLSLDLEGKAHPDYRTKWKGLMSESRRGFEPQRPQRVPSGTRLSSRPSPRNPAEREPEASGEIPIMFPLRCRFREFYPGAVPQNAARAPSFQPNLAIVD